MNPYETLGISSAASLEEIRQRYKLLAQTHHPDKGGDEEFFKQIKEAYEILSDPIRRKAYDSFGSVEQSVSIRAEMIEQISRVFHNVINNFNPDDDLIVRMKIEIAGMRGGVEQEYIRAEEEIKRFKKFTKRIRKKKDHDENLLGSFAVKILSQKENDLEICKRRIKMCNMMLELLEEYEYGELINQIENHQ